METLRSRLNEVVAEYEKDFEKTHSPLLERPDELHSESREIIAELGSPEPLYPALVELGASALSLAENLSGDGWEFTYILQRGAEGYFFGIPAGGLEIAAARRLIDSLPVMSSRASEIVWLVLNEHPSAMVRGYMRRLGRCYLAGFDPEVVILCRSVLDAALREDFGDDCEGPTNMYHRIEHLKKVGRIDSETAAAAHTIRMRGNKAVHDEPAADGIAEDTIKMTLEILTSLFPGEDA